MLNVKKEIEGMTDETAKEFAAAGIEFVPEKTLLGVICDAAGNELTLEELEYAPSTFESVEIDVAVNPEYNEPPAFSIKVRNKSVGRDVYFTDFTTAMIGEQKVLRFKASAPVNPRVLAHRKVEEKKRLVGLTFVDLCYGGAAELDAAGPDTNTALRPGASYADIGWMLSSRFTDTLIDALAKLNVSMFSDALGDSIIYLEV